MSPDDAADSSSGPRGTIERYVPGLALFRGYSGSSLRLDSVVALSLWAVVIPQALAYGELAGVPAVAGLYTALAGMLLYGLFGSSRYMNVGPESSVAIVVAASIASLSGGDPNRAIELTAMLALITAAFLFVGAALRLGVLTRLLSTPILSAYLTGSAIIIIASQIPKIFGISVERDEWWAKIAGVFRERVPASSSRCPHSWSHWGTNLLRSTRSTGRRVRAPPRTLLAVVRPVERR